jgi:hypothetical protein
MTVMGMNANKMHHKSESIHGMRFIHEVFLNLLPGDITTIKRDGIKV